MSAPWYAPNVAKDDDGNAVLAGGGAHGRWKSAWRRPIPRAGRRRVLALATADMAAGTAVVLLLWPDLDSRAWTPLSILLLLWLLLDSSCGRGHVGAVEVRRAVTIPAVAAFACLWAVAWTDAVAVVAALAAGVSTAFGAVCHAALRSLRRSHRDLPMLVEVFGGARRPSPAIAGRPPRGIA